MQAIYDLNLRQPLAGHSAISKKFSSTLKFTDIPEDYGVDIFILFQALSNNLTISEVAIHSFAHDPGMGTFDKMFVEVASSLLKCIGQPIKYNLNSIHHVQDGNTEWWVDMASPKRAHYDESSLMESVKSYSNQDELKKILDLCNRPYFYMQEYWSGELASGINMILSKNFDSRKIAYNLLPKFIANSICFIRQGEQNEGRIYEIITETAYKLKRKLII